MGCWNGTCAISNLPISDGEEVIGVFVISSDTGDPYSYHTPLPFYVEGKYNDYGQIEDEHGVMLNFMIDVLQKSCLSIPAGENEYHEFEIIPYEFTWESISAAHEKDRLKAVVSVYGQPLTTHRINILQIRKDVFDTVIENYEIPIRKDSDDWDTSVSFVDILDDYDTFYKELGVFTPSGGDVADNLLLMVSQFNNVFTNRENYIGMLLERVTEMSPANGIVTARDVIIDMIEKEITHAELYPVVENALAVRVLDSFMRGTHRQWTVPAYAGQDGYTDAHCLLASTIIEISEKMHQEMDDYEYE